ncbi:small G protein signaling modulator 2 isoform X7 [Cyanistes caeruleus]|uniref:small G protein signaling modulator 2 isoform X7 n=1 Tax=Cyanistes caeruleus TaxID=156563 RepID=UPI000CDAE47B|nr:small G protein signaling modulator 2 isoform X7 [Cyanistes caeruleus]
MEEAVTRKFVHEDSSHIIALCGVVEACLLHMLKRRAAGFLRTDKVAALFTKVGKTCAIAGDVCKKVQELQQQVESRKNQPNGQEPLKRQGSTTSKTPVLTPQAIKHIWVRTALIEKVLDKIVQYIVDNCSKYYEKEALLADPVCGPILASLLVGPCALEYTKLKTADHYWTDPSADELVQRHRIHGTHGRQDSPSKRPALGIRKRHSSGSTSEDRFAASAREYVESLHQNSRTHLLYGKNNVLVQPKDDLEAIPGYLSLHQSADSLTLKWTPNQLMNGTLGDSELEKSVYWDYALIVPLSQIVCIHCHQQPESRWTLVLVSQDGTQRPPLHFPQGGHLLAFLSCLENGLLPRGQLEPPLWSQQGKGKVFPKLRKRNSNKSVDLEEMPAEDTSTDYVFRIIYPGHKHDNITINYHHLAASRSTSVDDDEEEEDKLHAMLSMICSRNLTAPNRMKDTSEMIEMQGFGANLLSWQLEHCSQGSSCVSCSMGSSPYDIPSCCNCIHDRTPLKMLCESMKRQIISRAFYGWLAHCRHLSTVRTHLSALVNHSIVPPASATAGLTTEVWSKYQKDKKNYKELELLRRVYYGGVQHEIRKEVWPFLLGHYKFGMAKKEMDQIELLDTVALNLHRIDKDVQRCDRNYWYFTAENLEKLRNVMCSYVWEHLEVGYVQGMCDLLAPLMVILDNDQLAYSCFSHLMKRMSQNFPNGGAMDMHFANMRSLIQILDSELFELMHQNGDYTHFYFCYRWFLLDFKRELLYEDVFTVWEVIWAAKHISSEHFVLFIALALVEVYREIIRDNNMDFTDIIKFFNEMAEHHDAAEILRIARDLVYKVQTLIENK